MVLQSGVGGGRDGGAAILQMAFSPQGTAAYVILTDSREPTLQLVLAPGQEGRTAKLVVGGRPAEGLQAEGEAVCSSAGTLAHVKGGVKYSSKDAYTTLVATLPMGGGPEPVHGEFSYHQRVCKEPALTLGGTLAGAIVGGPGVKGLLWGAFGTWTARDRACAMTARLAAQPRHDGPPLQVVSVTHWKQATKHLELAATGSVAVEPGSRGVSLAGSSCALGGKMTFEAAGGLNPVLAANFSSRTSSLAYTVPFAGAGSATFLRSTASLVADHAARDFKVGASIECYY